MRNRGRGRPSCFIDGGVFANMCVCFLLIRGFKSQEFHTGFLDVDKFYQTGKYSIRVVWFESMKSQG